jgi:hypothetical protein
MSMFYRRFNVSQKCCHGVVVIVPSFLLPLFLPLHFLLFLPLLVLIFLLLLLLLLVFLLL